MKFKKGGQNSKVFENPSNKTLYLPQLGDKTLLAYIVALSLIHFLFALLTQTHTSNSILPRLERQNMWDHIMSMTNNASGMCCEEIEEFVMGREN